MSETDERKQYYEAKREPKQHLSRFRKHKQGPLKRYDLREELSFLDADETRES